MNFKWKDALFQPQWGVYIFPTQEQSDNIFRTAMKLETIKKALEGRKIITLNWLRSPKYNELVKGSKRSAHLDGLAVDFVVDQMHPQQTRLALIPLLEKINIRMEKLGPNDNWIHIDLKEPGPSGRYFTP
jgi:uncharacterized protein YcbK (DUF882 family)